MKDASHTLKFKYNHNFTRDRIAMPKSFLIVAAHPDDEILGCAGTASRLVEEGYEGTTLILGEGWTSRDKLRDRSGRESEINLLHKNSRDSNATLGISSVCFSNLPDNRFDTVPLLDVAKEIEDVLKTVKPELIFTHHYGDLNVDHRITHHATMIACRPIGDVFPRQILTFEVLSSTEWAHPRTFHPTVYFNISQTIGKKLEAMSFYSSEIRDAPHPRSLDVIKSLASLRGSEIGADFAEGFVPARIII